MRRAAWRKACVPFVMEDMCPSRLPLIEPVGPSPFSRGKCEIVHVRKKKGEGQGCKEKGKAEQEQEA